MCAPAIEPIVDTAIQYCYGRTMRYDPDKHHRRSVRLKQFDYSSNGAYFVTMVAHGRQRLFGDIVDGVVLLNDAGRMMTDWWGELSNHFTFCETDAFVLMPNHMHGVVMITGQGAHAGAPLQKINSVSVGADRCVRPDGDAPPNSTQWIRPDQKRSNNGLPEIVQWFKTMTTNAYIACVREQGWPPFEKRLWQRNYHEHIIRDEADLFAIRQYIASNPLKWLEDEEFI